MCSSAVTHPLADITQPAFSQALDILDLEVARVEDQRRRWTARFRRAATAVSANRPRSLTLIWTCCSAIRLCLASTAIVDVVANTDPGLGVHRPSCPDPSKSSSLGTRRVSRMSPVEGAHAALVSQRSSPGYASTSPQPVPPSSCTVSIVEPGRDNANISPSRSGNAFSRLRFGAIEAAEADHLVSCPSLLFAMGRAFREHVHVEE